MSVLVSMNTCYYRFLVFNLRNEYEFPITAHVDGSFSLQHIDPLTDQMSVLCDDNDPNKKTSTTFKIPSPERKRHYSAKHCMTLHDGGSLPKSHYLDLIRSQLQSIFCDASTTMSALTLSYVQSPRHHKENEFSSFIFCIPDPWGAADRNEVRQMQFQPTLEVVGFSYMLKLQW